MRFREIELVAFGPFAGGSIELGARAGAVDLVYGSNEAGKSTTLRAITGLLFGFADTTDAYRHDLSKIRVGATLESARSGKLRFARKRGRKATLRGVNDEPLDDAVLEPYLRGLTREMFLGLFGLDHETLRKNGAELAAGKGGVGESLFAAGMGARGLHDLSVRLEEESARLFVKGGRERAVNKALGELEVAREGLRSAVTTPARYDEQKQAHAATLAKRESLRGSRHELSAEQSRLQRVLALLPHLRRRAELDDQLARLGTVVDLGPDAASGRLRVVRELEEAARELSRLSEQRADLQRKRDALVVPDEVLLLDEVVLVTLRDGLSRDLAAQKDKPRLEAKAVAIEAGVQRQLASLGVRRAEGELQVRVAESARIRSLAQRRARLDAERDTLGRALAEATARRAHRVQGLARVVAPEAREGLSRRLALINSLASPGVDTVERFAAERAELSAEEARLARFRVEAEARLATAEAKLAELLEGGGVPSEDDLVAARAVRDDAFDRLRLLAVSGTAGDAEFTSYTGQVASADALADRLRREADRVAARARLEVERRSVALSLERDAEAARTLAEQRGAHEARWLKEWHELGLEPLAPSEMRAWARERDALLSDDGAVVRAEAALGVLAADEQSWKAAWSEAVSVLGLPEGATPDEALAVLDAMAQLVQQIVEAQNLRTRVDGIERDSGLFADQVQGACKRALPGASHLPAGEAAARLLAAVEAARQARTERTRLEGELVRVAGSLRVEEERSAEARARLQSLLAAAGAGDVDELARAEVRSEESRRLKEQLRAVDEQLSAAGEGAPLEALQAEASGQDLDRVRVRLREIDEQLDRVNEEAEAAGQEVWSSEKRLHDLEHTDASERAAVLQDRVAQVKRQVHQYLRVKLASAVLSREIERYRRENQGPLLSRASELFPRLTLGTYTGLRADFDEGGKPILLAARPDGSTVTVPQLSDGTRDQLFLALRLASLERYAQVNEPVPLVLDDVLVHFDEDRARAALTVLGETARLTQVLFFTHHARVVELAREALGPEGLLEHRLPAFGVG